ncbi:MAG TPA: methylmalonyl-CoA carboxyltransferase, partial [Erythrobacter sp.]|nr:methylmalonyl-CoA carboxyltransferase [Erythrobacter sp.]
MGWEKELEELRRREALAEQMGGPDKVARQHGRGKMDSRARLAALCDDGTFREIGKIAGKASYDEYGNLQSVLPAPFLFGKAQINGRPVVATADDFTIRGGAADAGISRKMVQAEKMAHELKLPIIRMIDGT